MSLKSHLQCGQGMGLNGGVAAKGHSLCKVTASQTCQNAICCPGIIFNVMPMKLREKIAIEAFGRLINS